MSKNIWLDGIVGVAVGDALGVPVEFKSRSLRSEDPVEDMRGYGTFSQPAGTWSDDTSMVLATMDSLKRGYDPDDIMKRFMDWMRFGKYTPFGAVFDMGIATRYAIFSYARTKDITTCGQRGERDNGNGSLMRIMPICLYAYEKQMEGVMTDEEALAMVHQASALTHAHPRSLVACGLYYFMVKSILDTEGTLQERLQKGLDDGFAFYEGKEEFAKDLTHYSSTRNLEAFKMVEEDDISSSGYAMDNFEAMLWCLLQTDSYRTATLRMVNLGSDTDTVAAIGGGLAGLFYGMDNIPADWVDTLQKSDKIFKLVKALS